MSSVVSARVGFAVCVVMCHQQRPTLQAASTAELAAVTEANSNGTLNKMVWRLQHPPSDTGASPVPRDIEGTNVPCKTYHGSGNADPSCPLKCLVGNSTRKQKNAPQVDKA